VAAQRDVVYVDVHLMPLLDSNGEVLGASVSFTDVTRFRQLRVEVETANRQLELAYEELQSTHVSGVEMADEVEGAGLSSEA
jgi:two-component system, chemotaxis family, CheB/CheR fusion protein